MKSIKFKLALIGFTLFAGQAMLYGQAAQASVAVARQKILTAALRGYEDCLSKDITAIVESAIFQSVRMKLGEPEQNYSKIIVALKRLAFEAPTPALRYKAYLAATIITNPEQFLSLAQIAQAQTFTEETRDGFFTFIAATIQKSTFETMLAADNR